MEEKEKPVKEVKAVGRGEKCNRCGRTIAEQDEHHQKGRCDLYRNGEEMVKQSRSGKPMPPF